MRRSEQESDLRRPPAALREFLEPYDPAVSRLFIATRSAVLTKAPGANELIYDAYNAVTCAYSFTDRLKEAFCHVAAYRSHVNLGFNCGAKLADPDRLLQGSGARIRHVRISEIGDLKRPAVARLVRAAIEQGRATAAAPSAKGRSIVQAVSARRRRPR